MPAPEYEIHDAKHNNYSKYQYIPVHTLGIWMWRRWEEGHDKCEEQEEYRDDVERKTPATEGEAAGDQGVAPDALVGYAGDGYDVGGDEGAGAERSDNVESNSAADIDERK